MTLNELRYLVAVAQERNFGRAAQKCFVSQPALSVAIQKLEEELGAQVFERGKNEVTVTPVGERIVEQAQRVLEETSRIREIACGPQTLRYAGETCWRGIVPLAVGHRAVEQWGDGTRVGVFPMTADTAYYYLLRCVPQGAPPPAWDELRTHFTAYRGLAGEAIAAIGDVPPLHHDLLELDRPVWGAERVLLLGDAAHAMTPNVGQGAAMAIEDAITLARVLDDGIDGALARHRTLREPRVRSVQLLARRAGLGVKVRGAWATRMRDSMMRAALMKRSPAGVTCTPRAGRRSKMRAPISPSASVMAARMDDCEICSDFDAACTLPRFATSQT